MAKGRKKMARWKGAALGTGLAAAVYLLGLLLVNLLLVRGVLADGFPAAAVLCVLAALSGGLLAARLTGWGAGTLLAAAGFLALLAAVGLGVWAEITARGCVLLLCVLAGGLLAGVLAVRRPRRRRK
ncbi:MAG: hypothetical protein HFG00_08045 [Oscillibacter sp.]|nr:hypothetical protein [Oscillibacter sp.]